MAAIAQRATLRAECRSSTSSTASAPATRRTDVELLTDDQLRTWCGRISSASTAALALSPSTLTSAAPHRTRTPTSRDAMRPTRTTWRCPASSASDGGVRSAGRARVPTWSITTAPRRRAGAGDHGVRRPHRPGHRRSPGCPGARRSAWCSCGCTSVPAEEILAAIPTTAKVVAVLDRTKEPGAARALFLDIAARPGEAHAAGRREQLPLLVGGRYGLSSREFTPAMSWASSTSSACRRRVRASPSASSTTSPV